MPKQTDFDTNNNLTDYMIKATPPESFHRTEELEDITRSGAAKLFIEGG